MEVKVIEDTKNRLKVELTGKTHTLCNLISKELWNDKDVIVSGYTLEHPTVSSAVLTVETEKGDAKKALVDALNRIEKINKEFSAKFKNAAK